LEDYRQSGAPVFWEPYVLSSNQLAVVVLALEYPRVLRHTVPVAKSAAKSGYSSCG